MSDKLDLVIQRIDDLKYSTNDRLDSIDSNLRDHMEQTRLVKQLTIDNQERIEQLEGPAKALKLLKSVVMYIGAIVGVVLAIMRLMENTWI